MGFIRYNNHNRYINKDLLSNLNLIRTANKNFKYIPVLRKSEALNHTEVATASGTPSGTNTPSGLGSPSELNKEEYSQTSSITTNFTYYSQYEIDSIAKKYNLDSEQLLSHLILIPEQNGFADRYILNNPKEEYKTIDELAKTLAKKAEDVNYTSVANEADVANRARRDSFVDDEDLSSDGTDKTEAQTTEDNSVNKYDEGITDEVIDGIVESLKHASPPLSQWSSHLFGQSYDWSDTNNNSDINKIIRKLVQYICQQSYEKDGTYTCTTQQLYEMVEMQLTEFDNMYGTDFCGQTIDARKRYQDENSDMQNDILQAVLKALNSNDNYFDTLHKELEKLIVKYFPEIQVEEQSPYTQIKFEIKLDDIKPTNNNIYSFDDITYSGKYVYDDLISEFFTKTDSGYKLNEGFTLDQYKNLIEYVYYSVSNSDQTPKNAVRSTWLIIQNLAYNSQYSSHIYDRFGILKFFIDRSTKEDANVASIPATGGFAPENLKANELSMPTAEDINTAFKQLISDITNGTIYQYLLRDEGLNDKEAKNLLVNYITTLLKSTGAGNVEVKFDNKLEIKFTWQNEQHSITSIPQKSLEELTDEYNTKFPDVPGNVYLQGGRAYTIVNNIPCYTDIYSRYDSPETICEGDRNLQEALFVKDGSHGYVKSVFVQDDIDKILQYFINKYKWSFSEAENYLSQFFETTGTYTKNDKILQTTYKLKDGYFIEDVLNNNILPSPMPETTKDNRPTQMMITDENGNESEYNLYNLDENGLPTTINKSFCSYSDSGAESFPLGEIAKIFYEYKDKYNGISLEETLHHLRNIEITISGDKGYQTKLYKTIKAVQNLRVNEDGSISFDVKIRNNDGSFKTIKVMFK